MTIFNKDLQVTDKTLFATKLDLLLTKLRTEFQAGTYSTREEVIEEFNKAIKDFYTNVVTPTLQPRTVIANTSPNYLQYNANFQELNYDLVTIFKQLASLEQFVLGNFNFMVSERDKLNQMIRRIASQVDDYALYSEDPNGALIYFKDSFNDLSKIDFASALLKEKQAEINVTEGIVTLPVIRDNLSSSKTPSIQINANSGPGGSVGNYQELGAAPHDDIRDVLDNNPDTWFEYERVQGTREENTTPLVLDLTLYFDEPVIINFVRINPNNFGTQTSVEIVEIETSLDGAKRISIKDDIPIAGFLQEDEANIFTLAPSTSKYAGQGLFTFTPRKAKYLHLVLRQTTPYLIQTTNGSRWRYAIGIRDIEVSSVKYEVIGEVVSKPFSSAVEIQKVSLLASENPTEASDLADVVHQISVDDGATWYDIQPQDRNGTAVPEILAFNTEDPGAIQTQDVPYALRHKMVLSRKPDKFKQGAVMLSEIDYNVADIFSIPRISPILLTLTRVPIDGSVRVMNPVWGSRALGGTKLLDTTQQGTATQTPAIHAVGRSNGQPDQKFQGVISREINSGKVRIWKEPQPSGIDYNELVVWIDNDPTWERVGDFTGASNNKEYKISNDGTLTFGNRDTVAETGAGRIPPAGSIIGFTLKEERLALSAIAPFTADLVFPSDGDKGNIKIYRYDAPTQPASPVRLRPGSRVTHLPHQNIVIDTIVFAGDYSSVFSGSPETFVDGSTELNGTGDWSIDTENGVLYSYDTVPAGTTNWTITYTYQPRVELQEADWDFIIDADKNFNRIQIYESGYGDILSSSCTATQAERILQLTDDNSDPVYSVVPGSLTFDPESPFVSGTLPIEVKFIDGETEFEIIGSTVDTTGWYSVDYKNGMLYISPADSFAYEATVQFSYTNFVICYNIAQYLPTNSYTINPTTRVLTLNEREALKVWYGRDIDITRNDLLKIIYDCVKTTRDSIEELEPYFTPIVRHVVIKVAPPGITLSN